MGARALIAFLSFTLHGLVLTTSCENHARAEVLDSAIAATARVESFEHCEHPDLVIGRVLQRLSQFQTTSDASSVSRLSKLVIPSGASALEEFIYREGARFLRTTLSRRERLRFGKNLSEQLRGLVVALELGDRTDPRVAKLVERFQTLRRIANETWGPQAQACRGYFETLAQRAKYDSGTRLHGEVGPPARTGDLALVDAARRAFGTSFQSCSSLRRDPVNERDSLLRGIEVRGRHPDGVGLRRFYGNMQELLASHYYVRSTSAPENSMCLDLRGTPPIYDYGGKPFALDDPVEGGSLNPLRNAGTGSNVLGSDCSGFVVMAMARAGLRFRYDRPLRASSVFGVSSTMLAQPERNGLSCLTRATLNGGEDLRAGDLIASRGHVALVEAVGANPFGLRSVSRIEDCRPENVDSSQFNFVLLQSAPTQGGIGLFRVHANHYLRENERWTRGLLRYAVAACRASFGEISTPSFDEVSVVRVSNQPACWVAPVEIVGEQCIAGCS